MISAVRCVLYALALAACGPAHPVAHPDGGTPDGGAALVSCMPDFGKVYIIDTYGLLPSDQGFDLTGDGKPDNILGALAPFANPTFLNDIKVGSAIFLLGVNDLPDPLADSTDARLAFWVGIDGDMPPDPTNNLSGSAQFLVPSAQLDVDCNSTTVFQNNVLHAGKFTAATAHLSIVAQAIGDLESTNDRLSFEFAPDETRLNNGLIGGISTTCALAKLSSPITPQGTLLDNIVGAFGLQPDIDVDGHGLDHLSADSNGFVTQCQLPDGTLIDGHGCPCDARMTNGYSLAFFFTALPANIIGLAAGSSELH
jgi:hypothetical protein